MTPIRSLLGFYLRQQLRSYRWFAGLMIFLVTFGFTSSADDRFSGYNSAALLGLAVALNFGIATNSRTGFAGFVGNHVSAIRDLVAKITVTLLLFAAFFLAELLVGLAVSGSPQLALWYTARCVLLAGLLLPATLLLELLLKTELAGLVAALIAVIGLVVGVTSNTEQFIAFMGIEVVRGSYGSLGRLLTLNLTWNMLLAGAAVVVWRFQHRDHRVRPHTEPCTPTRAR